MNKKVYMAPTVMVISMNATSIMAGSNPGEAPASGRLTPNTEKGELEGSIFDTPTGDAWTEGV